MSSPTAEQVARGVQAIRHLWETGDCPPTPGQLTEAVLRTLTPRALAVDAGESARILPGHQVAGHTCTCGEHVPSYRSQA